MEETELKQPFEIYKQACMSTSFEYYKFDVDLKLSESSRDIVKQLSREFHWYLYNKANKFKLFKRTVFNMDYIMYPNKYPPILNKSLVSLPTMTDVVPGNKIDRNMLIGYFNEFSSKDNKPLLNLFGDPIHSFTGDIKSVIIYFSQIMEMLQASSPEDSIVLTAIKNHIRDSIQLFDICKMIGDMYKYTTQNHLSILKSGHLLPFVSGLEHYYSKMPTILTDSGFLVIHIPDTMPIIPVIQSLTGKLKAALDCLVIDSITPAFNTINCRLIIQDRKILVEEIVVPVPGFFSRAFQKLIDIFSREKHKAPERIEALIKSRQAKNVDQPEENKMSAPEIKNSGCFMELYQCLDKFNQLVREDLEPERTFTKELVDIKNGFDLFSTPADKRVINESSYILKGKLISSGESKYTDYVVITSTYGLYDSIKRILDSYDFVAGGYSYPTVRQFTEDVKNLFVSDRAGLDESRKHNTFVQFRTNLRRLFSSIQQHTKYNNLINSISTLLDSARKVVLEEGDKEDGK